MNLNSASFRCVIALLILGILHDCKALYEDQIGKFDWRQEYVGCVNKFFFDLKSAGKKVIVATRENVLSAIDPRDGTILWRQVFESQEKGTIDEMYQSKDATTTLSGGAKFVRVWDSATGLLIREHSIPFLAKARSTSNVYGFNVKENIVYNVVIKTSENQSTSILVQTHYINREYSPGENKEIPVSWLNISKTKCIITWDSMLICVDVSTQTLYSYNLKNAIEEDNESKSSEVFTPHQLELSGVELSGNFEISQPVENHLLLKLTSKKVHFLYRIQKSSAADIGIIIINRFSDVVESGVVEMGGNHLYFSLTKDPVENLYGVFVDANSKMGGSAGRHFSLPANTGTVVMAGVHAFTKRDGSIGYRLLVSTSDHSIIMINSSGKVVWQREESLASILNVEMLELPVSDTEARFEEEFGTKAENIISMFFQRISSQVRQLQSFVKDLLTEVAELISSSPSDTSSARVTNAGNQQQQLFRDEFNLHKIIVVTTSSGKLFGIDNLSGTILWSKFIEELGCIKSSLDQTRLKLPLFVQRTTAHFPHHPQCVVLGVHKITGNSVLYVFDPVTGRPMAEKSALKSVESKPGLILFSFQAMQVSVMHYHDDNYLKPLLLLDFNEKVHIFPDSCLSAFLEKTSSTYIFSADVKTGFFFGYGFHHSTESEIVTSKLWKIAIPTKSQRITHVVTKRATEIVHSQGRVMGDRSVLYKYLNPNLAVVVTEGIDTNLKPYIYLYLVDGVTGNIVHSTMHKRVQGPVHVVHSENWIVYSYHNEKYRRTDVAVLELFEGKTQSNTTVFSSLHPPLLNIVEKQAYIFPMSGIAAMTDTITDKGMTSKHILVALPTGGILEIPKFFLDPRRPIIMTPELREEGLMPYIPELPLPTEHIINYNQSVIRVRDIYTAPAGLESTSLVFVYGLDLFYTRITPSKTFDVLKDDFDHYFITVVLLALIAASYLTKRLAAHKALKQAWK